MSEISCQRDYPDFLYNLFRLGLSISSVHVRSRGHSVYNLVIFALDKENDFPAWYTLENPRVRSLPVVRPDHEIRRLMARTLLPRLKGWEDLPPEKQEELTGTFVDMTGGMFAREMVSIVQLSLAAAPISSIRKYQLKVRIRPPREPIAMLKRHCSSLSASPKPFPLVRGKGWGLR